MAAVAAAASATAQADAVFSRVQWWGAGWRSPRRALVHAPRLARGWGRKGQMVRVCQPCLVQIYRSTYPSLPSADNQPNPPPPSSPAFFHGSSSDGRYEHGERAKRGNGIRSTSYPSRVGRSLPSIARGYQRIVPAAYPQLHARTCIVVGYRGGRNERPASGPTVFFLLSIAVCWVFAFFFVVPHCRPSPHPPAAGGTPHPPAARSLWRGRHLITLLTAPLSVFIPQLVAKVVC